MRSGAGCWPPPTRRGERPPTNPPTQARPPSSAHLAVGVLAPLPPVVLLAYVREQAAVALRHVRLHRLKPAPRGQLLHNPANLGPKLVLRVLGPQQGALQDLQHQARTCGALLAPPAEATPASCAPPTPPGGRTWGRKRSSSNKGMRTATTCERASWAAMKRDCITRSCSGTPWSTHLGKPQCRLDHLARLAAQQHQHSRQQLWHLLRQHGRKLVQQPATKRRGGGGTRVGGQGARAVGAATAPTTRLQRAVRTWTGP